MQYLKCFIKYHIIFFDILNSVTNPVNRHDIQVGQKPDEPLSLEYICPGKKNILERCIAYQYHCIHECILVIRGKNDRLVFRNILPVDHFDLPVKDMKAKFGILLK